MQQSFRLLPLLLIAVIAALGWLEKASAQEVEVVVGKQQTVFRDGYRGMHYFPDEPIVVINTQPWIWFMVDTNKTVLMQGRTLETSVPVQVVLDSGKAGDFDANYAGISGVYHDKQRKEMLAVYHAEKRIRDGHPEMRTNDWAIGLAVSNDGRTFRKMGKIITSSMPRTDPAKKHHGVGDPSLCLDASGEWLYCYYTDLSQLGGRKNAICMARCRVADGARPGKWQKYHNERFSESAIAGKDTPVVPHPIPRSDVVHPNVQYVDSLGKYVMTLVVLAHAEYNSNARAKASGFYVSWSDDGIEWTPPQQVSASHVIPSVGREIAIRPYLHISRATADGISGTLIYSYSPSWGWARPHTPHYMVKRSIDLKFSGQLTERLAGSKWVNSNNVTFEWTNDGLFLHSGKEQEWNVSGEKQVQITFGPGHVDTLQFDDNLKTFKQLTKGGPSSFKGRRR